MHIHMPVLMQGTAARSCVHMCAVSRGSLFTCPRATGQLTRLPADVLATVVATPELASPMVPCIPTQVHTASTSSELELRRQTKSGPACGQHQGAYVHNAGTVQRGKLQCIMSEMHLMHVEQGEQHLLRCSPRYVSCVALLGPPPQHQQHTSEQDAQHRCEHCG